MAAHGNGFNEEFVLSAGDREVMDKYGKLADDLHTDLHECLGHGSGQLAPGVKVNELKSYSSTLEETRADLFGLYYLEVKFPFSPLPKTTPGRTTVNCLFEASFACQIMCIFSATSFDIP